MNEEQKKLLEQYETTLNEQKVLLAKGSEMTQEDFLNAQKLDGTLDTLDAQIKQIEQTTGLAQKNAERIAKSGRPAVQLPYGQGTVHMQEAGFTQISNSKNGLSVEHIGPGLLEEKQYKAIRQPEYKDAFQAYLQKGWNGLSNVEQKFLQEGSDTQGGFMVPEEFMNSIIMKKPTPTRVSGYVTSLNTSRDALAIPRVNYTTDDLYTTGIRVTWTGENPASSTAHRVTDPVFGQVRVPVYTAMLSIPLTNDLIEDSAVDLQSWLEDRFAETIELLYDNMILNGTGVGQPNGILLNPGGTDQPAIVNSGNASALTADGIVSLGWSLPEQYDDDARWVFNKVNTGQAIAKLKDAQNRYIWGQGYQDSGLAPSIKNREMLGYPVNYSGFMPNIAGNAYPIIFGDFRGYYLVRRVGFSVQVLNELYAETNQKLLLGRLRFGGTTGEAWRFKVQKVA